MWDGRLAEAIQHTLDTGLDQISGEVGSWFTRYPGRPDYFTHWGEAFRYAASVIGLPTGDYSALAPSAGNSARSGEAADPHSVRARRLCQAARRRVGASEEQGQNGPRRPVRHGRKSDCNGGTTWKNSSGTGAYDSGLISIGLAGCPQRRDARRRGRSASSSGTRRDPQPSEARFHLVSDRCRQPDLQRLAQSVPGPRRRPERRRRGARPQDRPRDHRRQVGAETSPPLRTSCRTARCSR